MTEPPVRVRGLVKSFKDVEVCVGILVVAYVLAMLTYRRKLS